MQLDGVTGARKIAPAIPPTHPERPALVRRLGELAAFHGFGDRPVERAVPPPLIVPPAGSFELPGSGVGALTAGFSRDGNELVAVASGGELVRWDLVHGRLASRLALGGEPLALAALAPDLDRVACRAGEEPLVVRDAVNGMQVAALGEGAFSAIAWSPCGKRIATGSRTGDVAVWDAASGRCVTSWWAHPAPVQAVAFDFEGAQVGTGAADGRVTLWAADSGKRTLRVIEPENHPQGVGAATRAGSPRALVFTGGGAYLMAGLTGGGLVLWDRESGHRLWTPPAHAAAVRSVRAVHGGLSLATSGQDGALVLWDALTGEPLAMLTGHQAPAFALAVSPDGSRIASGGGDAWLLLWDLPGRTCDMNEAATRRALALYARRALERLGGRPPD